MIIRAGTGFDNIDVNYAENRNIHVCNTPDANAICAFEHTLSFILSMIKQHRIANENMTLGKWKADLNSNWEMSDLKALIVGVGRVGTRVANALKYFGARVKGVDPYLTDVDWQNKKVTSIIYKEGLKWCNLVSFHCPLNNETKNYFDDSVMDLTSNPIWLINTARGGIISLTSVKKGLENSKILGFATDVYSQEPSGELEISRFKNALLSPHIGSFTKKAKERLSQETLAVWKAFVFQNAILNPVQVR
jgi:D-3-phosphoglycerate dehydrogenase